MPWTTPPLDELRKLNRDNVTGGLNAGAMVPNSVLRVLSDANAGLAYLNLLYIDWLSRQLLPDTAEGEWLKNRHAKIWLGGWKQATFAAGSITATGTDGTIVPVASRLSISVGNATLQYETLAEKTIGSGNTTIAIRALQSGAASNMDAGTALSFSSAISGADGSATVVTLTGGANEESDDDLRTRVLFRIQRPPMGGDADDYVRWALEVPGVTRAWASPLEMGVGTVTLRFMMDELRATADPLTNGFPNDEDIAAVRAYMGTKRPVAVKDFFVEAPIPEPISFTLSNLVNADASTLVNIQTTVKTMLKDRAAPAYAVNGVGQEAQTIYAVWVSEAVLQAADVEHFDLVMTDHVMPSNGHMAVLGSITVA